MQDLHGLPKLRDSLSYLYVEHAVLECDESGLRVFQETGKTRIPTANLCVLMLGPGTTITHAAVRLLADSGCSILWVGQDVHHFYAQGNGETRRGYHLLRQATLAGNPDKRLEVVLRMYEKRFGYKIPSGVNLEQVRGMEGARMRTAYQDASRTSGVEWNGRAYDRNNWNAGDPVNRALSAANAVLNGLCHAAIVSGGYSPGLGFIHTGKQLSFVYDIADLYKVEITIPMAFQTAREGSQNVEQRVREACRERFREVRLLERILPDIDELLSIPAEAEWPAEDDPALPEPWWVPTPTLEETEHGRDVA